MGWVVSGNAEGALGGWVGENVPTMCFPGGGEWVAGWVVSAGAEGALGGGGEVGWWVSGELGGECGCGGSTRECGSEAALGWSGGWVRMSQLCASRGGEWVGG